MFVQHLVNKELSEKVEKKINISAHSERLSPFRDVCPVLGRAGSKMSVHLRDQRRSPVISSKQPMASHELLAWIRTTRALSHGLKEQYRTPMLSSDDRHLFQVRSPAYPAVCKMFSSTKD